MPSTKRKIAAIIYECVLLFGITFIIALFYAVVVKQNHALYQRLGLQLLVFIILGIYFIICWCISGQTLAMKTWRIQLKTINNKNINYLTAIKRYVLCWVYLLMPTIIVVYFSTSQTLVKYFFIIFFFNIVINILYMHFSAHKQFIYDKLLGLHIIQLSK